MIDDLLEADAAPDPLLAAPAPRSKAAPGPAASQNGIKETETKLKMVMAYEFDLVESHAPIWTLDAAGVDDEDESSALEAQAWFNRGVQWMYAFNHEEAVSCFAACAKAAPRAPEPRILASYCNGVNYNNGSCEDAPGEFPSNADAVRLADEALALVDGDAGTSAKVAGLARAMRGRCALPGPDEAERKALNEAFAREMEALRTAHADDADVVCLYVESVMVLRPWDLYTKSGEPRPAEGAFPGTEALQNLLRTALDTFPAHAGLLHMQLHCLEMSATPAKGRDAAQALADLARASDLGHLLHMPAHIWIQTGEYEAVVEASRRARAANRMFVEARGVENFCSAYRYHDMHMQIFAACQMASRAGAFEAATELREDVMSAATRRFLAKADMADVLEAFSPMILHVHIRFGAWEAILDEDFAEPKELYVVYNATLRYARGLAHAALGDTAKADHERELFGEACDEVPQSRTLFNNTAKDILALASRMLEGEIEYRKGNFERAFASLREAVALDDAFVYDEPWPWMVPTRHALGSLLLEQGRAVEARAAFLEDLGRWPANIWSLSGMALCAERAPDACAPLDEAQRSELESCRRRADTSVRAPCLCMLSEATRDASTQSTSSSCCHT